MRLWRAVFWLRLSTRKIRSDDSCFDVLSGELRYDIPVPLAQVSQLQVYGFSDWGELWTHNPLAVGTPAQVEAASIGGGLRFGYRDYVNVDLQAAKGIEGPRHDWRFFFAVSARY